MAMMECPRCKFVQPVDRFCANCGLNIDAFAAKPKPLMQRLLAMPAFYVVVAVISGVVLIQVVKKTVVKVSEQTGLIASESQPVANNENQVSATNSNAPALKNVQIANAQTYNTQTAATDSSEDNSEVADSSAPVPAARTANLNEATSSTLAAKAVGATEPAVAIKPPTQMELSFYEIARESWVTLSGEGKPAGEQNGWRALAFASRDRLQATLTNARRLPGGRQLATQSSSAASLHFPLGMGANQVPLGLFVDLSVVKMEGANLELEIMGQLELRHDNNQETHQKAGFVANFNSNGALVLVGLVPRKTISDPANHPTAGTPLSVLESPDFLEGQSEVVLVIQGR